MRLRAITVLFTILTITPAFAATRHAAIPRLTVSEGDNGTLPLTLDSLQIHVLLRGHLARTTYDLTYRNATNNDLDGDFMFPLPPDAEISDLGLYFNGRLRHAVPVERVIARSIYEATVHRRVDPALAEWTTSSRAFHFRIYPIPANGVKVVHIAYDQELTANPYELDLRYGATLPHVDLTIESDSRIDAEGLPLMRSGDRWSMRRTQYQLDGVIRAVPDKRETAISARSADGNWYASAAVNLQSTAREVEPATHMTILYDASASAAQRDDAKVREYLRQLLARQKIASISVVPFHIAVDAAVQTDAGNLEQTLGAIPAAGATNLAELLDRLPAIAASPPAGSRIVLVSDGINSIGDASRLAHAVQQVAKMRRPLTIINASPSADDRFLGGLARATGGWYIDLTHVDPATAAEASMRRPVADGARADAADPRRAAVVGAYELAIRILTDLIEANPDDAAMMRIIGRVLSGWGRDDLARLIFERALEISPRETQTWRELFLLDIREGQDLTERQKRYASFARDERMQQTDAALQAELQRSHSGIDPRIDPNAELQIETMWDSNYTDIDLHVVEPGGEEVYYSHPHSAKNGLLHADITTGFGPETYTLPRMASGPYKIALVYYSGDTTRLTMEALVHVIIYIRGQRQDHFIVLTGKEDRRVVATVP